MGLHILVVGHTEMAGILIMAEAVGSLIEVEAVVGSLAIVGTLDLIGIPDSIGSRIEGPGNRFVVAVVAVGKVTI